VKGRAFGLRPFCVALSKAAPVSLKDGRGETRQNVVAGFSPLLFTLYRRQAAGFTHKRKAAHEARPFSALRGYYTL